MAELLIFHHAQGLTAGCHAFGERMTAAGHTVHLPDLYDGRTFATLEEGIEIDLETARRLDATLEEATFFAYPGDRHLFADESLPSYDPAAAQKAETRVLELLDHLG